MSPNSTHCTKGTKLSVCEQGRLVWFISSLHKNKQIKKIIQQIGTIHGSISVQNYASTSKSPNVQKQKLKITHSIGLRNNSFHSIGPINNSFHIWYIHNFNVKF